MALRAAIASGNWSNPAIWNDSVLPVPGDVVASNGFTVTIDQSINVDRLTNAVANLVSAVPIMTGYTTPSGIVTFSSEFPGYSAFRVFDGSTSNGWITANTVLTGWVAYEFTTAKIITSYVLAGGASGGNSFPRNWTFEGWDGSNWIVLHTVTGNTNTSTYTGNFTNTTAYIKYRINITLNNGNTSYTGINEMYLYESGSFLTTITAGGGFILNSGVTVTCTNTGVMGGGASTLITYSGSGTSTINANLIGGPNNTARAILFNGTGTLNIVGTIFITNASDGLATVLHSNTGILNVIGSITTNTRSGSSGIQITSSGTLNYTGDVYSGSSSTGSVGIRVDGTSAVVNMTGNIIWQSGGGSFFSPLVTLGNNTFNLTGNVFGGYSNGIQSSSNLYLKVIGTITAGISAAAISSTSSGAINIFTGPFISSSNGIQPFYVTRMHYQRTLGSYYEFRDSSTNGALPPAAAAPAIRMNSPEVASDLPTVANVRFGAVYGVGSFTGTMRVPAASNVRLGVAVDTTVGTGAITAQDVWNVLTSGMNTTGSIGARLKNASTVDTTGNQLAAYL